MHRRVTLVLSLLPALCLAQTGPDHTVTVTASRNSNIAPDQAVFNVAVTSPVTSSRDDIVAALQGSGVTAANFTSVYTSTQPGPSGRGAQDVLQWNFQLVAPLSSLKNTVAQLTSQQRTIAQKNNGISLSFGVAGAQTSPQALAGANCAPADLIADARAQAQKMASAAGLTLGSVVGVSSTSVATPAEALFSSAIYQPACSLTVKFALTGF
jgi:uncharacterized protein YggE